MRPIGVFDSGIGGLSVLQALQAELPHERFVYLADNGHAPYGEKSETFVRQRSLAIAQHLIEQHHIKALVVACNTATALAVHELRHAHPALPLVGMEPALKPAAQQTRTGRVGVMATPGTVGSAKFQKLLGSLQDQAEFVVCPCPGLALAIEQTTLPDQHPQALQQVGHLLDEALVRMGPFGNDVGQIDTLVLGCTHYVFARQALAQRLGPGVQLISTGEPVARQTRRILAQDSALASGPVPAHSVRTRLWTTGPLAGLQAAADRWLGLAASHCHADAAAR